MRSTPPIAGNSRAPTIGIGRASGQAGLSPLRRDGTTWIVTWASSGTPTGCRISPTNGNSLDGAGYAMGASSGSGPVAAGTGGGAAIAVWTDNGQNVLGTRLQQSVPRVLDSPAFVASTSGNAELSPVATFHTATYRVFWLDERSTGTSPQLYGARLTTAGAVVSTAVQLNGWGTMDSGRVRVASSAVNSLLVWDSIVGVRGTSQGLSLSATSRFTVGSYSNFRGRPDVAWDGTNYLVVWQDGGDIRRTFVAPNFQGIDTVGVNITNDAATQQLPSVAFDGTNYLVVWEDNRAGSTDVYGARISKAGVLLDVTPKAIATVASAAETRPRVASDGAGGWLVVWEDHRASASQSDVYGARVAADGTVIDLATNLALSKGAADESTPEVAWAKDGVSYLVVWRDARSALDYDLYGTWVKRDGTVLDPSGVVFSAQPGNEMEPSIAADGAGKMLLSYQRFSAAAGTYRARARLVSSGSLSGATCATGDDCASRLCADTFCCRTACGATTACTASGECRLKQGQGCSLGTECASGNCTDGVCCSSASCGNYVCSTTPGTCPTSCTSDADCAASYFCGAAGACVARRDKGQSCDTQTECKQPGCRACTTGLACADGYCCDSACVGACDECKSTPGTCKLAARGAPGEPSCQAYACTGTNAACGTSCVTSVDCASNAHCEANLCKTLVAAGAACAAGSECASGFAPTACAATRPAPASARRATWLIRSALAPPSWARRTALAPRVPARTRRTCARPRPATAPRASHAQPPWDRRSRAA